MGKMPMPPLARRCFVSAGINNLTHPLDADTDDDAMTDGDEVFAGTDPLDRRSLFEIFSVNGTLTSIRVEWSVVPGRQYQVYRSTDLLTWIPYREPVSASAGENSLSILDSKTLRQAKFFYKVEVLP